MYSQDQEVKLFISEQTHKDVESCILHVYMLTCAHAYTHTRLHACAYMIARLYWLICNLYNTIVFTCLLTNLRCTEDSNRTVLGGQYSVGTGNVVIASVGENPRPQLVSPCAETKITSPSETKKSWDIIFDNSMPAMTPGALESLLRWRAHAACAVAGPHAAGS